ncbi:MAG: metallopeptidase family protein [Longimicrobiales bacterium]
MRFNDFEKLARQQWEKVPAEYKQGVDGLMVERDAKAQAEQDEIYTLGECQTESFPSDFGGPDTTRSAVVLYYGSFLRLSHLDGEFDWESELWETLTHELQHHLEALATTDELEDFDFAVDENFKRLDGQPFDALFFRAGARIGKNRYQVEEDVFIEVDAGALLAQATTIEFDWEGMRYRVLRPAATNDVRFLRVNGGPHFDRGELWLVLVPRRGVLQQLRAAWQGRPLETSESEAVAEPVL